VTSQVFAVGRKIRRVLQKSAGRSSEISAALIKFIESVVIAFGSPLPAFMK
jgi:hypothetical protein